MEDLHFARKTRDRENLSSRVHGGPVLLDADDTPLMVLLRDLFIEQGAPFCVKALASDLGLSVYSVYKMFAADRPLRAETLLAIVRHIGTRDHRLIDLICGEAGYTAMPSEILEKPAALRELLECAARLTKGEGKP